MKKLLWAAIVAMFIFSGGVYGCMLHTADTNMSAHMEQVSRQKDSTTDERFIPVIVEEVNVEPEVYDSEEWVCLGTYYPSTETLILADEYDGETFDAEISLLTSANDPYDGMKVMCLLEDNGTPGYIYDDLVTSIVKVQE